MLPQPAGLPAVLAGVPRALAAPADRGGRVPRVGAALARRVGGGAAPAGRHAHRARAPARHARRHTGARLDAGNILEG